jgi:B-cell receptor-associated protein 31
VNEEQARKIAELTEKVEASEKAVRDLEVVRRQAEQQHAEYMRLTDRYNELERRLEQRENESRKEI